MANYANLKAAIDTVIKANGQQEITGTVLNQTLTAMVNSLGAGYLFMGVAIPSTNPGTPDQNVFYLAGQAGTYSNFGAIALQAGLSILKWNGTWSSDTLFTFDASITQNSANPITSGAVFEKLKLDGGAYDVSAHNNNQTFASLSALLSDANLSTLIPTNIRSGGMSIKFIQTSDNKYVQWRLMAQAFSTTITDWQGVDEKITPLSNNLATSGGVDYSIQKVVLSPTGIIEETHAAVSGQTIIGLLSFKKGCKYRLTITASEVISLQYDYYSYIKNNGTNILVAKINAGETSGASALYTCNEDLDDLILTSEVNKQFTYKIESIQPNLDAFGPGVVTEDKLADNAVSADKIKNGAVTENKIPDLSIPASKLKDGIDTSPSAGSEKFVKSGGIEDALITNALTCGSGIKFSHKSVGGVITKIATFNLKAGYQYQIRVTSSSAVTGTFHTDLYKADGTRIKRVDITSGNTTNISDVFTLSEDLNGAYISAEFFWAFEIEILLLQHVGNEKLKDNSVSKNKLQSSCIDNSKLEEKSIAIKNLDFLESKNLVNTQDPDFVVGKRLESDGSLSNGDFITTGFMSVEVGETYVFSAQTSETNIARFAILYNENKEIITGGYSSTYKINGSTITIPETAKFYRVSYYSSASNLQFEKGTIPTSYEPYKPVIPNSLLPQQEIGDNSITLGKVTNSVSQQKGIYISIPDNIYAVVGDKLQLFFRSIIHCANVYNYDVIAICSKGKSYPRYWEYTPVAEDAGTTKSLTIRVRNTDLSTLLEKTVTVHFVSKMSSPSANKNVLCVGASATANGYWVSELKRRLTTNTGEGTAANPTGLNLSNITFVGRKEGVNVNVPLEATGGWMVQSYASAGETAFRMQVTGVNELHIGDTYTSPQGGVFVLQEINVTEGVGNLRFTFNSSIPTISASGTLTRIEGSGDATITYTSYDRETFSPFWNDSLERIDFTTYANDWCNGSIDVMIWHCGVNDIFDGQPSSIVAAIDAYKNLLRRYHIDFPNGKVIISSVPVGSLNGGFAANYGASNYANSLTFANSARKYALALEELCSDNEFSSFTMYCPVLEEFDSENSYPTTEKNVNNRNSSVKERIGSNAVHPTQDGSYLVADAVYRVFNAFV